MMRGAWEDAIASLCATDGGPAADLRARCLLAAALRRSGRTQQALAVLRALPPAGALDRLVRMETHFCARALRKERLASRPLRALIKMLPADADAWLELSMDFAGAGLLDEAAIVLQEGAARVKAVDASPLVHYTLAYWIKSLGREAEAAEHRRTAAALSPSRVFPYHWELEAALRDALAVRPQDALAHCCLGTLLYAQERREEALAEWEAAVQTGI